MFEQVTTVLVRAECYRRFRARGYSRDQAKRLVGKLRDGPLLELLRKYGPTVLAVLRVLIPLILLFVEEPPEDTPVGDGVDELPDDVLSASIGIEA